MHHALCGTTLRPPEVKSCGIIWCIIQREHNVENRCDLLGFNTNSASKTSKYAILTQKELLHVLLCILQHLLLQYFAFLKPKYSPEK